MKFQAKVPVIVLLAVFSFRGFANGPPVVDGKAALDRVRELVKISPRDSGTENARKAAEWIRKQCVEMGVNASIDRWTETTAHGEVTFQNVAAVIPGKSTARLIIGSHYDTKKLPGVPDFQGANDSGSSTGLLLEMMRVIKESGAAPPVTLEFVFFDGEECVHAYGPKDGLHGSKHHARKIVESGRKDVYGGMILLDMIGDADLGITLCSDTPADLGALLLQTAGKQGVQDLFGFFGNRILDDHRPFAEIGIPAIVIIDFSYGPNNSYWHTVEDTMDKLSANSLEMIGNVTFEMIWTLGDKLRKTNAPQ